MGRCQVLGQLSVQISRIKVSVFCVSYIKSNMLSYAVFSSLNVAGDVDVGSKAGGGGQVTAPQWAEVKIIDLLILSYLIGDRRLLKRVWYVCKEKSCGCYRRGSQEEHDQDRKVKMWQ